MYPRIVNKILINTSLSHFPFSANTPKGGRMTARTNYTCKILSICSMLTGFLGHFIGQTPVSSLVPRKVYSPFRQLMIAIERLKYSHLMKILTVPTLCLAVIRKSGVRSLRRGEAPSRVHWCKLLVQRSRSLILGANLRPTLQISEQVRAMLLNFRPAVRAYRPDSIKSYGKLRNCFCREAGSRCKKCASFYAEQPFADVVGMGFLSVLTIFRWWHISHDLCLRTSVIFKVDCNVIVMLKVIRSLWHEHVF